MHKSVPKYNQISVHHHVDVLAIIGRRSEGRLSLGWNGAAVVINRDVITIITHPSYD